MTTPQTTAHQYRSHPQTDKVCLSPFLLLFLFLSPFYLLGSFVLDVRFEAKAEKVFVSIF